MVAEEFAFLDNMTRGRVIMGMGPGALPADAQMIGASYRQLRGRMEESLEVILALYAGTEPVTRTTEWFEVRDARLQLLGFRGRRPAMAIASALSPSGPRLAGKHGLGLLSMGGTSDAALQILASTWDVMSEQAHANGQLVRREDWAIVGMMHIAPTEREARDETRFGLKDFYEYRHATTPARLYDDDEDPSHDCIVDRVNATGAGVIGTPAMAVEYLRELDRRTGGFGCFLHTAADWADPRATRRSYELFAREVLPLVDGSCKAREHSYGSTKERRDELVEEFVGGIRDATDRYRSTPSAPHDADA